MDRRKRLALLLLLWCAFALLLSELAATGLVRERIDELADALGLDAVVDLLGGVLTTLLLALLVSLALVLILHGHGGLALFRKSVPSGAQERNKAGLALFRQGGYVAAISEFTEALHLDPGLAVAFVNRGAANFQMDNLDRALADLDAALALKPGLLDALGWRGQVWFKLGEFNKALADYNEALALRPDYRVALGN